MFSVNIQLSRTTVPPTLLDLTDSEPFKNMPWVGRMDQVKNLFNILFRSLLFELKLGNAVCACMWNPNDFAARPMAYPKTIMMVCSACDHLSTGLITKNTKITKVKEGGSLWACLFSPFVMTALEYRLSSNLFSPFVMTALEYRLSSNMFILISLFLH